MARHSKTSRFSMAARLSVAGAAVAAGSALMAPAATAAPDSDWDRLAQCESGGNWSINTGNGFHGGLQFSPSTWNGYGGQEFAPVAYQATREQQIVVAERVLAGQGWGAWPACSAKLGLNSAPTPRTAPAAAPAPAPAQQIQKLALAKDVLEIDHLFNALVEEAKKLGIVVPNEVHEFYRAHRANLNGLYTQYTGNVTAFQNQVQNFSAQAQALLPR